MDDNKHEVVAYGDHDEVAGVDVDTYMECRQGAHLEGDPADAEVDDMDSLRQLGENVGTVVELEQIVMDDDHKVVEEHVLMLLGYTDQLATGPETQVVDLALSPLIASSKPAAWLLRLISIIGRTSSELVKLQSNPNKDFYLAKYFIIDLFENVPLFRAVEIFAV